MSLLHHGGFYLGSYQLQDVQIHYGSWDSPDAALKETYLVVQLFHGVQRNHLDAFFSFHWERGNI